MIDRTQIARLADAASIRLDAVELDRITAQLRDILQQLEVLIPLSEPANGGGSDAAGEVDAAGIVPIDAFADGWPDGVVLREDTPAADPLAGTITRFAPETRRGFFTVPPVPGAER